MELNPLTALSPLDGRYHTKLDSLRTIFSEFGLIFHRTLVEIRWLQFLSAQHLPNLPPLTKEQDTLLNQMIRDFSFEDAMLVKKIEQKTNHDVKAVEYFLQQKLTSLGDFQAYYPFIHFACTSEDINNLAYALMLVKAKQELLHSMKNIVQNLSELAVKNADIPMLARTHGQAASPTAVGKELMNFVFRLQKQMDQFSEVRILGKFNGAVGNFNAHHIAYPEINWPELSEQFVSNLGLHYNAYTTQIEPHDFIAEYLHALTRFNNVLIDVNRDLWGYISLNYFQQKAVATEVGSSTMPHKINPIDFENSEGNLGVANALADHMANKLPISRWQRDLTDSTVLRNLGMVAGHSLLAYQAALKGLSKLDINAALIKQDLENHWEVLAEAVQTVMRRYGDTQAYERLKDFSRGKKVDQQLLQEFIQQLNIPTEAKQQLLELTPSTYTGYAIERKFVTK
jgi:adenylosuccinate lyase